MPAADRIRGQAGNERVRDQWVKFIARKNRPVVANTAIARELGGLGPACDAYTAHPDHVAFVTKRWIPEVADFSEIDLVPLDS